MIGFVICCITGAAAGASLCGRLLCGRLLCSAVLRHDFSYPVGGPSLTLLWRII
jgi:hypothetical protein